MNGNSMKKHADAMFFHTAICAGASQIALMAEEKRKSEFLFAPSLTFRNGDYYD